MYRLVAAAGVLPIIVEVVRRGVTSWVPARDAAPTVLRARFALGSDPTLVGMFTDSSRYADSTTYFPGAWQLYWMWTPIKVLGTTWGPLVAIGLLNILWFLLAGWFVKRRLGHRAGALALVFVALANWVLSPGLLVSPVPMAMVLPAFAAFLFGAWALAAGDEGVLVPLAVVANFLLLDHLVLTLLVPVIGAAAAACWVAGLVWARRDDRGAWPEIRKRSVRAVLAAGVVTLVMWVPAIVEQLRREPGNLSNLITAARGQPAPVLSYSKALEKWLSLFVAPGFWSRASRESSYLLSTVPGPSLLALTVSGVVLVGVVVFAAWKAVQRRDRPAFVAVILTVVAFGAVWMNIRRAVGPVIQPAPGYVQSSWIVAMFITFALVYACARARPRLHRSVGLVPVLVAGVVVCGLDLPHATVTGGTTVARDAEIHNARVLNARLVQAVQGRGVVALRTDTRHGYPYAAAAIVALDDADGIRFCADGIEQFDPGIVPDCGDRKIGVEVAFATGDPGALPANGWRVEATSTPLPRRDAARLEQLTTTISDALERARASGRKVSYAPNFVAAVRKHPEVTEFGFGTDAEEQLNPEGGLLATAAGREHLATVVVAFSDHLSSELGTSRAEDIVPVRIPGVESASLLEWAKLYVSWNRDIASLLIRSPGSAHHQ